MQITVALSLNQHAGIIQLDSSPCYYPHPIPLLSLAVNNLNTPDA
jgi:hypothetical protein